MKILSVLNRYPYRSLLVIFLLAIVLRIIYFPGNIYFGSDQARDAYYSLEVVKGNPKIVGPGSSLGMSLHHGVLYYYLMGPVYLLSGNSPVLPALVVLLINAVGVFLAYWIGRILFNSAVGLLTALLFAVSYEQSQYAAFFSHPSPAVISVLLYYLGLSLLFFKGNSKGLILAVAGAAISLQFHFSLITLFLALPLFIFVFRRRLPKVKKADIFISLLVFLVIMSSFIIAELKYRHIISFVGSLGQTASSTFGLSISNLSYMLSRFISFNFLTRFPLQGVWSLIVVGLMFWVLAKKEGVKTLFLGMWLMVGCVAFIISGWTALYVGIGASVSLLIVAAALIYFLSKKYLFLSIAILVVIVASNLYLIYTKNMWGPNEELMAPHGMLLKYEMAAIDYIYSEAGSTEFSVHGLTIPYNVKTTWDYLFNWYGKQRYGFVPVWGGEDALGSEGSMVVVRERSKLPELQFLVIDPLVGLDEKTIVDFMREESYFTHLVEEKQFGTFKVQKRQAY